MCDKLRHLLMFTFEHTHQLSEAEYVQLWGMRQAVRWGSQVGLLGVGLALLWWPYTIGLGVVTLVFATAGILLPRILPGTAARTFRQSSYLTEPVTYGASADSVWVKASDFTAEVSWRHVVVWRERGGWLILQGSGFPPVLLPIATLKIEGLYDQVKAQVKKHAVEFGSAEAGRKVVT